MKKIILMLLVVITLSSTVILSCANNETKRQSMDTIQKKGDISPIENKDTPPQASLNIATSFVPCGWMGDGKRGKEFVNYEPNSKENPHSAPNCIKISYRTGPEVWAGIYWLNKDCNWGDESGYDLSSKGYTKITFWAKGAQGGESVQFKAGGVKDKKFKDSFDYEPKLDVSLENQWQQYTINLKGKNLSNVIGGFCWVSASSVTFYLDDMQYE